MSSHEVPALPKKCVCEYCERLATCSISLWIFIGAGVLFSGWTIIAKQGALMITLALILSTLLIAIAILIRSSLRADLPEKCDTLNAPS